MTALLLLAAGPPEVVAFLAADCPLAKLYAPRLAELSKRVKLTAYGSRRDSLRALERFRREHGLNLLPDPSGERATKFGAKRSPEVFVLDAAGKVCYRGRIDDQFTPSVKKAAATRHELRDALEAVASGKAVSVPATEAPGCPLPVADDKPVSSTSTFHRDIAPILQRRCQQCHRPGQSAPFSLLTFAEAKTWRSAIREVIEEGRMPPWSADPKHGKFANDPSLTASEKKALSEWIDGGTPEGNESDAPPPRVFKEGWTIPEPDEVLETPGFDVPAEGVIEYQYFRVDPGFKEDKWVIAAEVRPGNPAVVHHCNVFLQPPGVESLEQVAELGALGSVCLTMSAQGTPPLVLKDGRAKRIPAGWRIIFVMHYQAIGSRQTDRTRLGLVFADAKDVRQEVATKLLYDPELVIPPRKNEHLIEKEWKASKDVLLLSLFPHMHLRGKTFTYEHVRVDGSAETLLHVPAWDFAWQHRYELAEPLRIKAGESIRCRAVYDNSEANPHNPDPAKEVRAGQQSTDEMFNGYFDVCLADEDRTRWRWPWALLVVGAIVLAWVAVRRK